MTKRWIDLAYWAIVAMTFMAISGLGFLATQALREQAFETAEKKNAEALARVKRQGRTFFEDLPQNLRSESALEFLSRSPSPDLLPIPDSPESLPFFVHVAQTGSSSRSFLLEGLLNAEIDCKPFWYLALMKRAFQDRDLEGLHRYAVRIRDWPQDYVSIMGLTMKTHAAFYEAEAFLLEGKTEMAVRTIQLIAGYPAPNPVFVKEVRDCPTWTKIKNLSLFQILLWAWANQEMDFAGPRFFFFEKQVLFMKGQGVQRQLFNGRPFLVQLRDYLQSAAGEGVVITLEENPGSGTQLIPLVEGVGFSLRREGQPPPVSQSSRLLIGFLFSLGLFGLAMMTLFNLKRRQESLVQEEKEWLFRQAAHDLKTPLTTIRALAETLSLGRIQSAKQGPQYLEKILHECDYSAELIDSLLLTARLRTGAIQIAPEEISLLSQIKYLIERFNPRMDGWKISLDIPPGMTIHADPQLFQRVIMNLLENVIRHAGTGKTLEIDSRISNENRVELRMGDRGPGFVLSQADGMERNESGGTHTRSAGGLGLSLIRRIMDLHGGTLKTESRTDGGALVVTSWKLVQKG